jgi:hypothetical protein
MIDGDLNNGARTKRRQSRRTGYRRRLRMQRLLLACIVGSVFAGACWLGAHLSFPARSSRSAAGLPESTWFRGNAHQNLASMAPQSAKPGKVLVASSDVYPYSVVPGGLKRAEDLRKAASQDAVVRSHYSHFDFDHARLVRVKEAREVYVSYRIRNTVYWTKKKIRLHVGELLLTDGTTTARAHCGNQISDTAKPEISEEEPDEDVLNDLIPAVESPYSPIHPVIASADLLDGQPVGPQLFAGGFIFPYVPYGVPLPGGRCPVNDTVLNGRCQPHLKPIVIPEPSTLLLIFPGLAMIALSCRVSLGKVRQICVS